MMFSPELRARAEKLLADARAKGLTIATAESCTGGLVAGLLTEIPGSSDVLDRGYVTYSNQAKEELLGVPRHILKTYGAVSAETARAMADGALKQSRVDITVAVTGIAGPGGGTEDKPVGLVHFAAPCSDGVIHRECRFGDVGRKEIRLKSVDAALEMLEALL